MNALWQVLGALIRIATLSAAMLFGMYLVDHLVWASR